MKFANSPQRRQEGPRPSKDLGPPKSPREVSSFLSWLSQRPTVLGFLGSQLHHSTLLVWLSVLCAWVCVQISLIKTPAIGIRAHPTLV